MVLAVHTVLINQRQNKKRDFKNVKNKLAAERGEAHIGADTALAIAEHRATKQQLRENQRQTSLKKQHR